MLPTPPPAARDDLLFDAVLTPHRSLSPRGFMILMSVVAAVGFLAGLAFFLIGAWPVVGFMGLEVLLVYGAFRINYRHAQMYEVVELTRERLTVKRVNPWGEETSWRMQPYWLQVEIAEPPQIDSPLTLRSHGRSLTIGSFLTAEERLELAQALRCALGQLRCVPAPIQTRP